MKILYNQLKQLVPGLTVTAREVGEVFTMTGLMLDGLEEVSYQGKKDWLLSLEVRQNRPDCLSVWGLARDLAAYYGLSAQWPVGEKLNPVGQPFDIKISSDKVKRVKAVQLAALRQAASPAWLTEWLAFYGLNSVNLSVDLSNYVMLLTGYASHLIDSDKVNGRLEWRLNQDKIAVATLDGTAVALTGGELVIADQNKIVALAGIVGCRGAEINQSSTNVIVEMALYDRGIIRENARRLGIVTEAGQRLSHDLAPNGLDDAFAYLIALLMEHGGGTVISPVFDYGEAVVKPAVIDFDPALVSRFAGIAVAPERSREILENLRCHISEAGNDWQVTAPADRLDLRYAEDLVEEVVRFVGYDKIPIDEVPALAVVKKITPVLYDLKDHLRDLSAARGFDEILSQPLVADSVNNETNYLNWQPVTTQNSVNEEFPDLRQSLVTGLLNQWQVFKKKNINFCQIFEIGKVFGRSGQNYQEHEAWGLLRAAEQLSVNDFKREIEYDLRSLGLTELRWRPAEHAPLLANSQATFELTLNGQPAGLVYKLKPLAAEEVVCGEVNLDAAVAALERDHHNPAVEVLGKLVALDANVETDNPRELEKVLERVRAAVPVDNFWSVAVVDEFALAKGRRYTVRVIYRDLSDQEAKESHTRLFKK